MTPGHEFSKNVARKRGIGSLAALLTGVAASAFAIVVGTQVLQSVHNTASLSELKARIDISHLLAIQTVSSASFPMLIETSLLTPQDSLCLAGEGTGCVADFRLLNLAQHTDLNSDFGPGGENCSSAACSMRRTTRFSLRCVSTTVCPGVEIDLRTEAIGRYARQIAPRESRIQLPSALFEDRTFFDFVCGNAASLTGLDLVDRRGLCESIPQQQCAGVELFENATSVATSNCRPVPPQNCSSSTEYVNSISLVGSACASDAATHTAYYWGPWANGSSSCNRSCGGGQYVRTDTRRCLRHSTNPALHGSVVVAGLCAGLDGGQPSRTETSGSCNTHTCCYPSDVNTPCMNSENEARAAATCAASHYYVETNCWWDHGCGYKNVKGVAVDKKFKCAGTCHCR